MLVWDLFKKFVVSQWFERERERERERENLLALGAEDHEKIGTW